MPYWDKISEVTDLEETKQCSGSQLQRSLFLVTWLCVFGPVGKQYIPVGAQARLTRQGNKKTPRGQVPILPSKATPGGLISLIWADLLRFTASLHYHRLAKEHLIFGLSRSKLQHHRPTVRMGQVLQVLWFVPQQYSFLALAREG